MRPQAVGKLYPLLALCLLVLSLTGSVSAEDSVTTFTLPEPRSASGNMSGADMPWLDTALGAVGLPGTAGDDETTYDRARRMQSGYGGSTRLSYGERYRRNPDGSYGAQSSSRWGGGNVADRLLEQALSAGSGYFSSWAEGWLGGYGNARIQLRINDEGEVTGAGDFLLPLYDSERSTFFTQLGLRTMANDRVIGNFGLGQRFFPADNFAFGYNAFIDQDFSRNHTRGGVGLEAWYDWLRLSGNYYTPLSGWKDSEDYDRHLVEERPAEGFDARLTGYLPFYRNLAVTGGYEKWKGDHVGSFGNDDVVQKDPKIWSYGLEWTPVPAFAASVNQRHSGGHDETQFGLTFNYHFGMDWEDQLSPAMVAEMRTVDGSRHEFVNRQNEIILAYQAKEGTYNIVLWRTLGNNTFEFRLTNGFGEPVAGRAVQVSVNQGVTVGSGGVFSTNADGVIQVALTHVPAGVTPPLLATLSAGRTTKTIPLASGVSPTDVYTIAVELNAGAVDVVAIGTNGTSTPTSTTIKAAVTLNGSPAPDGTVVNWSFAGSEVYNQSDNAVNLAATTSTTTSGVATLSFNPSAAPWNLTPGNAGRVGISAAVANDPSVSAALPNKIAVGFDQFRAAEVQWYDNGGAGATAICGLGKGYSDLSTTRTYYPDTNLPTAKQLQAVSGGNRPASQGLNAYEYWTGEAFASGGYGHARNVNLGDGVDGWLTAGYPDFRAVCLR